MAQRIRDFPWSSTQLGPMENWSELLLSYVNLMLCSPLPTTLCWGRDLVFFYNDAAIETVGGHHPLGLGGYYRDVFKEAWHLVGPDIMACFERGETPVRENIMIPLERNGVLQDFYWTYWLLPVYQAGAVVGIYDPFQNTTETVLALRERDAVAEQLSQLLEDTSESVMIVSPDWTVSYMNPEALRTSAPVNPVGQNLWESYPALALEGSPWAEHYRRAMEQRVPGTFEAFYGDPINVWVAVQVKPSASGITIFFRDISDNKKSEAALRQNEKLTAVGRLASSIAHEINNPLESVTNLLYLLRTTDNPREIRQYAETAERELRRVSMITSQTLRFHKQATRATRMPINVLLQECVSLHHGRILNSRIEVVERLYSSRLLLCLEGEIRQVLNNLIGNAIDAMPAGGRLLLKSREGVHPATGVEGVLVTVADTGYGMSAETRGHLFEAFYTTKGIGGTGLGLWISAEIIARHHGSMRVRSTQLPGRHGTVFTLFLPFVAAGDAPPVALN